MKKLFALLGALLFCAQVHASSVNLTWNAPSPTPTFPIGYNVYRVNANTDGTCSTFSTSTWTQIVGSINAAQTNWSDKTIAASTTYCYAVTAYNATGGGESGPSNIITVVIPAPSNTPPSPSGLSGSFIQ